METRRIDAFSDGVIAIAITLLVLDIHVDAGAGQSMWRAIGHEWPSLAGYAVSFLTIGIMWVNHHSLFDRVGHVDRGLLYWNLVLLAGVGILPFTTGLMAQHLTDGARGRVAVVVYALSIAFVGAGYVALWWHLSRHDELLADDVDHATVELALRRTLIGPVLYLIAAGVGAVSAIGGLAVTALPAIYFAIPPRVAKPLPSRGRDEPGATA